MSFLLTQAEADALIAMPKRTVEDKVQRFPAVGERLTILLVSMDRSKEFLLDVTRSRIDFSKVSYQNRSQVVIILMRLDLGGAPHRNPDGTAVSCPHMHVYKESYGDKWAYPMDETKFQNLADLVQTLSDFMAECNVVEQPRIQAGLF